MTKHIAFSRAGKNQHTVITHAFTMAEILLSLTIIGVVAAITLPSLTGNINERTWNTQRKALYARMSQAIALMPALNGYGTLTEETDSAGSTSITDTAAETFITNGLAKVLKINNICDSEHLADCGIPTSLITIGGSSIKPFPTTLFTLNDKFNGTLYDVIGGSYSYSQIDTKAAAFETQNGESIVVYYNPYCAGVLNDNTYSFMQPKLCANFIYDLNGSKGPNTVGKDIGFISALYPTDSVVVAPLPLPHNASTTPTQKNAGKLCQQQDTESRMPNLEELASMYYNQRLIDLEGKTYWSSTVIDIDNGWCMRSSTGQKVSFPREGVQNVRCIKR